MARFSIATFLAPKRGYEAAECEDAVSYNARKRRFSIADGATEGFASRYWARLLVRHWTLAEHPVLTGEQLVAWAATLGSRFELRWQGRKLPWFAEEKARLGAFAAFVGLSFIESQGRMHWQAVAVGDSCFIVRRRGAVVESFPLDDPGCFSSHPVLLASNRGTQQTVLDAVQVRSAPVEDGDCFFLLTDAIAAWFLRSANAAPADIATFDQTLQRGTHSDLVALVEDARSTGSLRNDDVGVVRVGVAL